MPLPRDIALGEYYHIYNRGAHRHALFKDTRDWVRFLFGIMYYQSPTTFDNVWRLIDSFSTVEGFAVSDEDFENVIAGRGVELVAFCIMTNHYHLIVRELAEGGIARYMHRVQGGYTMYANTKYQTKGHVFENRYKSKHVPDNTYLTHLSAYIHKNPSELSKWNTRYADYPWSSLQDYTKENRWGGLLAPEVILDQFEGTKASNYADFVKTSLAKAGFEY